MTRQAQSGSVLTLVLIGLAAVAVLATIAYGSYYQIARGTQDTANRARASALLTQAAYTLATEASDTDGDGIAEPLAGQVTLDDGWQVPASSGAPKTDPWGTPIKYCAWDNGSVNASPGRFTGANPALQTSIQFAVVSAGPDKVFNTTCLQALSGAQGDDGVRTVSVAQINQGVGGTYFYGDPVASVAALPGSGAPAGMLRIAMDTQLPYLWNGTAWMPLNAGAWLLVSAGGTCSGYPPSTLAHDVADNLYICTSTGTRIWQLVH
jgi:hypothetical protein